MCTNCSGRNRQSNPVPPRLQKFDTLDKVIVAIDSGTIKMAFANDGLKETKPDDIWYWRDLIVAKEGPLFTLRTAIERQATLTLAQLCSGGDLLESSVLNVSSVCL